MATTLLLTVGILWLRGHAKASDSTQFLLDEGINKHANPSYLKYVDLKGVTAHYTKYLADKSEAKTYFKLNPSYCMKDPYTI